MLATDLAITAFGTSGTNLSVTYDVATQNATAFNIGIYTSTDGTTPGSLLMTKRVTSAGDLAVGTGHTISFQATFGELIADYKLLAKLDSSAEVSESNESNNISAFSSGIFLASDGVAYVHGTDSADTIDVSEDATWVTINFNSSPTNIALGSVVVISVRAHGGADTVTADDLTTKPVDLFGGAGNDVLTGGDADVFILGDYLEGGAGNDTLTGNGWNDGYVYTGTNLGTDTIAESTSPNDSLDFVAFTNFSSGAGITLDFGSTSPQTMATGTVISFTSGTSMEGAFGTAYADVLTGNSRANAFEGLGGNDTLYGGSGADDLEGGDGDDALYGEAGNDYLLGDDADDGSDLLEGGADNDELVGNAGNDGYVFSGYAIALGTDTIYEQGGDGGSNDLYDYLDFSDFNSGSGMSLNLGTTDPQTIAAGTVVDLFSATSIEGAFLTAYSDTFTGNSRDNAVEGLGGNDTFYGGDGADDFAGQDGDDVLYGEGGNDLLSGGNGEDRIEGGAGDDDLWGNDGNDTYVYTGSSLGIDSVNEEINAANDALDAFDFSGFTAAILLELNKTTSNNVATGTTIYLNNASAFEKIIGTAYADTLRGNTRNNYIQGGTGNDTIYGGDGDDELFGEGNDDSLYCEAGNNDKATGGSGTDYADGGTGTNDDEVDAIETDINFEI